MLELVPGIALADDDLQWRAIRAQGAGGQNVNKVASALHLRIDIRRSALPASIKQRLLASGDRRISADGILVIKAQRFRSQEKNRADAIARLRELLLKARQVRRKRIPTKPGKAAQRRRLDDKAKRGDTKRLRRPPID